MRIPDFVLLLVLTVPAMGQESFVVPKAFATKNAASTSDFPFTYTNYVRYQQAIDVATMGNKVRILDGLSFRPRRWPTQQNSPFVVTLSIRLSLSANAVNQLDGTYGNNVKGKQVEVWRGPVYFHTPSQNSPTEFATTIWFAKSYVYLATDPLLIDIVPLDKCAGGGNGRGSDYDRTSTGMGAVLGKNKAGCGMPTTGGFRAAGGFVIKFFSRLVMPHGRGCPGSNGVPVIASSGGGPARGNMNFKIDLLNGAKKSVAALTLGFTRAAPYPIKLPAAPDCWLWNDIIVLTGAAIDATGKASVRLPLPNIAVLADKALFVQWAVHDRTANGLGWTASAGGIVAIR
ncbi:MAG: hypothetical protein CMJ85_00040 [Planctomycetes bacterium]|nr:hypothetical protein [Planctomycetota bacterium]